MGRTPAPPPRLAHAARALSGSPLAGRRTQPNLGPPLVPSPSLAFWDVHASTHTRTHCTRTSHLRSWARGSPLLCTPARLVPCRRRPRSGTKASTHARTPSTHARHSLPCCLSLSPSPLFCLCPRPARPQLRRPRCLQKGVERRAHLLQHPFSSTCTPTCDPCPVTQAVAVLCDDRSNTPPRGEEKKKEGTIVPPNA